MNPFIITIGLILLGVGFAKEIVKKVDEKPLTKKPKTSDNKPTAKTVPTVEPIDESKPAKSDIDPANGGDSADTDLDNPDQKPE